MINTTETPTEMMNEPASGMTAETSSLQPKEMHDVEKPPVAFLPVTGGKPGNVPEKFWDHKKQAIRIGMILQSYQELERKLSGALPAPDSDENKTRVLRALGLPESPDEYDVDTSHGLFDVDPDMNSTLFEKGFTLEQVQAVYDMAAQKFVPMVLDIAHEFQAEREVERLISAFGGEEKWQEISRQLLAFGQKNLPKDVLETLSSSFEGVMMLHRMMKGEEPSLAGDKAMVMDNSDTENALKQMMRDPKYWRDKDPAFVGKVTEGFRKIYQG